MKFLSEAPELLDFFLADAPLPDASEFQVKKLETEEVIRAMEGARGVLAATEWTMEAIEETLRAQADELGLKAGQLFQPLRLAITGRRFSPGIFETVYHVGREQVQERLDRAIKLLR
jgi:glutamyl-tRNA synthetase